MKTMTRRVAYLTIDDGPSPHMSEKLEYLWTKGVPAIWFCQGNYLHARPDLARQAIDKGFVLGNHSFDHPHFSGLATAQGFEQITRTDLILEGLYRQKGIVSYPRYFRFPYGDKGKRKAPGAGVDTKTALQRSLRQMGYLPAPSGGITYASYHELGMDRDIDWYWTYDVMDWSINSKEPQLGIDSIEKVLARMDEDDPRNGMGLHSGSSVEIILIHDHEDTSRYFMRIIDHLLDKGLSFELPDRNS